jgi:hypothetical protein
MWWQWGKKITVVDVVHGVCQTWAFLDVFKVHFIGVTAQ